MNFRFLPARKIEEIISLLFWVSFQKYTFISLPTSWQIPENTKLRGQKFPNLYQTIREAIIANSLYDHHTLPAMFASLESPFSSVHPFPPEGEYIGRAWKMFHALTKGMQMFLHMNCCIRLLGIFHGWIWIFKWTLYL